LKTQADSNRRFIFHEELASELNVFVRLPLPEDNLVVHIIGIVTNHCIHNANRSEATASALSSEQQRTFNTQVQTVAPLLFYRIAQPGKK
jgi:hypothetical protein